MGHYGNSHTASADRSDSAHGAGRAAMLKRPAARGAVGDAHWLALAILERKLSNGAATVSLPLSLAFWLCLLRFLAGNNQPIGLVGVFVSVRSFTCVA